MKKGNTPMEFDLKGLFKSTVEETKLKERYTVSSIWKKSFWDLYYQFQFQFQSVLFRLKTIKLPRFLNNQKSETLFQTSDYFEIEEVSRQTICTVAICNNHRTL